MDSRSRREPRRSDLRAPRASRGLAEAPWGGSAYTIQTHTCVRCYLSICIYIYIHVYIYIYIFLSLCISIYIYICVVDNHICVCVYDKSDFLAVVAGLSMQGHVCFCCRCRGTHICFCSCCCGARFLRRRGGVFAFVAGLGFLLQCIWVLLRGRNTNASVQYLQDRVRLFRAIYPIRQK